MSGRSNIFIVSAAKALGFLAALIISILLLPTPSQAKTLDEYDADISAQEAIVAEKEAALAEATNRLAEATSWYYKNTSLSDIVDMFVGEVNVAEAIDKISYMDKIYDAYAQKKAEAEAIRAETTEARDALVALRQEKKNRARTLSSAANIQFPQSGEEGWSGLRYWTGTVATSGCGLCAYTVVIDVLCGLDYTPADMWEIRGDWKGMDGYSDDETGSGGMTHHDFTRNTFDVETWEIDTTVNDLREALSEQETAAIVCSRGRAFKDKNGNWRWSNGHFVAVLGYDESGFHVSDSAYPHETGADVIYDDDEMRTMLSRAEMITVYSN